MMPPFLAFYLRLGIYSNRVKGTNHQEMDYRVSCCHLFSCELLTNLDEQ